MTCKNITFGAINQIEFAALSASPESITELDWLKNHHRARRAKWTDLSAPTVITGTYEQVQFAEYFALIGSNLKPEATVKLELFASEDVTGTDLLQMDAVTTGQLIPLGLWRTGVDGYNVRSKPRGEAPLTLWFDRTIQYQSFRLTIEHGYEIDETVVFNDLPTQDEFGVVSLEAEDGEITNIGARQWVAAADATASGGSALHKTGGGFYTSPGTGPRFRFVFAATQSGTHKIWVRAKSLPNVGNDSFHVSVDGASSTFQNLPTDGQWHWVEAGTCVLSADSDHTLEVSAREDNLYIDKVVILPNTDPAPTGTGPAASTYGVVGSTDSVELRMLHMGLVWRPERNMSYGVQYTQMTPPELGQTTSGHTVQLRQQREVKQLAFELGHMTDGDRFLFQQMEKERAGRPIFVAAYPDHPGWIADEHTFLARLSSQQQYTHQFESLHSTHTTLVEV